MKSKHDDRSVKHWEKRAEEKWSEFQFNHPYENGLKRLREEVLGKTNFDPATLWQWGTMQATALIETLKSVERAFGREGQQVVFDALRRVGYDIGKQITAGTSIPEDMSNAEWMSFFTTVVNRIAYASLETPEIESATRVSFHIDWCPHQDHYEPMDCRVQRYFVQGMVEAAMEFLKEQGREDVWDVAFKTTIPAGSDTCFFEEEKGNPQEARKWSQYTDLLDEKALKIARGEKK